MQEGWEGACILRNWRAHFTRRDDHLRPNNEYYRRVETLHALCYHSGLPHLAINRIASRSPVDAKPSTTDRYSALRGTLALPFALVWALLSMVVMALLVIVLPSVMYRHRTAAIRLWGRGILAILGIHLDIVGNEHLDTPEARVIMFNHINLLDLPVIASCWRDELTVLYKREFHNIPMMGFLMHFFGMIPINRGNIEDAKQSLEQAGQKIVAAGNKVLISPEGTRNPTPRTMLPFKKGPFHLVLETKAPIQLLVMTGNHAIARGLDQPLRSGTVQIDFPPPIATAEWTETTLDSHMDEVRNLFLHYVNPASADSPQTDSFESSNK